MKELNRGKIILVFVHVLLGAVSAYSNIFASVWAYVFFFYSIDRIIRYRNSDGWALLASAYLAGLEIVLRLTNAYVFSELGKYGIVSFLLLGMFSERNKQYVWRVPLMYFLLLLHLQVDFYLNFLFLMNL